MSVQSVSSAAASTDLASGRRRATAGESGQGGEVFALPAEGEGATAASAAGTKAESAAANGAGRAVGQSSGQTAASPAAKTVPMPQTAQGAPMVPAVTPGASPELPAQPSAENPVAQPGTDPLLSAAIVAQFQNAPVSEVDETEQAPAEAPVVQASPVIMAPQIAALQPVETPKATAARSDAGIRLEPGASLAAAIKPEAEPSAAALSAQAQTEPSTESAGVAEAGANTAGPVKPTIQFGATAIPLPAGAGADAAKAEEAGTAVAGSGQSLAAHLDKIGKTDIGKTGATSRAAAHEAVAVEAKGADALQPLQGLIDLSAATQARPVKADAMSLQPGFDQTGAQAANAQTQNAAASGPPTPVHVVPIEIGLRALAGGRNFDIRLDPAELGRVDVSLSISDEGEVKARLVVDRVETLHLLQRDARTLERAFEQAGLKPSNAGVDITLRDPADQGFRQNRQQEEAPRRAPSPAEFGDDAETGVQPVSSTTIRGLVRLGGVDLSI